MSNTIGNLREHRGWQITASWTTVNGLSVQLWHGSRYGKTITNRYQSSLLDQISVIEDILDDMRSLPLKNKPANLQSA